MIRIGDTVEYLGSDSHLLLKGSQGQVIEIECARQYGPVAEVRFDKTTTLVRLEYLKLIQFSGEKNDRRSY